MQCARSASAALYHTRAAIADARGMIRRVYECDDAVVQNPACKELNGLWTWTMSTRGKVKLGKWTSLVRGIARGSGET